MNLGLRIFKYAKALTPEQLAELLALHHTSVDMDAPACIHVMRGKDAVYKPLIARKLILWDRAPAEWSGSFRAASLTKLGQQVLLNRISDELIKAGAIPVEVVEPE